MLLLVSNLWKMLLCLWLMTRSVKFLALVLCFWSLRMVSCWLWTMWDMCLIWAIPCFPALVLNLRVLKVNEGHGVMKICKGVLCLFKAVKKCNLYVCTAKSLTSYDHIVNLVKIDKTLLWHNRLGHISQKGLKLWKTLKFWVSWISKMSSPFVKLVFWKSNIGFLSLPMC